MKHIRITLSLLIVVVLAMAGIFYVESITTPIVEERLAQEANRLLYEMFEVDPENPGAFNVTEATDKYPEDTQGTVSKVYEMTNNGQLVGVIYQGNTAGINPGIVFLLAVDSETNESVAVSILTEAETAGIGKDWLAEQSNLDKYAGQTMEFLRGDSVDTTAGVTLTGNGLNTGIKKALNYHGVAFLGEEAAETPAEMVERLKSEWLTGTVTSVDPSGNIIEILESDDGAVFMTVNYTGYSTDASTYVIGFKDGQVLGFASVETFETPGLGEALVNNPEFWAQFENQNAGEIMTGGVDFVAGSTAAVTLQGINDSLIESIGYYVVEYLGGEAPVIETPEMMVERLKSEWFNGATLTDVYGDYAYNDYIVEVMEADGGYFFSAIYVGFEQAEVSSYIMGIKDGVIIGFASVETFETPGIGQTLVEHPEFAAQFAGKEVASFLTDGGADFVAGVTEAAYTLDGVNESVMEVLDFYQKQILGIQDEEAPVITIDEGRPTTFEVGASAPNWDVYVTATDNDEVASLTNNGNTVDFGTAGTYTVTFTAVDPAGNTTTADLVIEITSEAVAFELIAVPESIQPVLEGMFTADGFHDEGITTDLIQGVYTARTTDGEIQAVFYNVSSNNGSWAPSNSIMVQFAPGSSSIDAVNVFIKKATYYTDDYAPNNGVGEDFNSPVIAAAWVGVDGSGQVVQADLDSVSGTTAEESFPSMIESIEHVIQYQIDNNIGGAQ